MTRAFKGLLAGAFLMAAVAIFLSALLFSRLADTTTRTNDTLCTFRADVQQRVSSTETFLAAHPQGIPGVPVATLRQSLDAQRRTVKALSGLPCS